MQLVINTYGTYLHIKDDLFEVRLRKDKVVEKHHFASQKIKSILISKGSAISTDAVILAMKNNIDIIVLENDGTPVGRFWHSRPGSTSRIRKRQLEASLEKEALTWIKKWLSLKLENQEKFLGSLMKNRVSKADSITDKIDKIKAFRKKIELADADTVSQIEASLRGYEGSAGRVYFTTLSDLLNDDYKFNGRSFRPAQDPFNAFLNYAYGILYSRVEKALVIAGLDPYVGFMHRDDYNTKSLVFDFIEPFRTYGDEVVFKLFSAKKVNKSHCDKITNGFSLNAEGKNLLVKHFFKYFDEDKIRYKNRNQSRGNIIQFEAHTLANKLIEKNKN